MDEFLKIIAIISGLLAIVKGGFDILKEYRSNSKALSTLWSRRRFRVAAGLTMGGIIAIIAAMWFITGRTAHTLTVQIWNISFDEKNSIVASERFTTLKSGNLPDELVKEVGQWIVDKIGPKNELPLNNIDISVHIPSDLSKDNIQIKTIPAVEVHKYLYVIEGQDKARIKTELDPEKLSGLNRDFYLEIRPVGYSPIGINVTWGKAFNRSYTSRPKTKQLSVAIEEFTGEKNSFGIRLSDFLQSISGLQMHGPDSLANLRNLIDKNKALIASSPWIQMELRTSLELDYTISGRYEID